MVDPRVADLMAEIGAPVATSQEAEVVGHDPVLANRFPVSEAAGVALAAGGVAVSDLWEMKTGRRQKVRVHVRKAGVSLRSTLMMRLNGGPPPPSWADGNPLVDLYHRPTRRDRRSPTCRALRSSSWEIRKRSQCQPVSSPCRACGCWT